MTDKTDKEELVCAIQFYYDPLTEVPKYRLRREDPRFIDPLSVYAMACIQVIEDNHSDVIRYMEEIVGSQKTDMKVH